MLLFGDAVVGDAVVGDAVFGDVIVDNVVVGNAAFGDVVVCYIVVCGVVVGDADNALHAVCSSNLYMSAIHHKACPIHHTTFILHKSH